jgi:hypothetical protein
MNSKLETKRWNVVDLHLKIWFQIFSIFFKVFWKDKFWDLFIYFDSPFICSYEPSLSFCDENEEVLCDYLVLVGDSNQKILFSGSIFHLRSLFFFFSDYSLWSCLSLPLTVVDSHLNCRNNDLMMKILQRITENHHEFIEFGLEFAFWKFRVSKCSSRSWCFSGFWS